MPLYGDLGLYYGPHLTTPSYFSSPFMGSSRTSSLGLMPIPRLLPPGLGMSRMPPGMGSMLPCIPESGSLLSRRPLPSLDRVASPRPLPSRYVPPKPMRIDTADIDVSSSRFGARRRDREEPPSAAPTSAECSRQPTIKRGRTVVRLHTKRLKENPALENRKRLTPGEKLVQKFLIRDRAEEERKRKLEEQEELERVKAEIAKLHALAAKSAAAAATTAPTPDSTSSVPTSPLPEDQPSQNFPTIQGLTENAALDILICAEEEEQAKPEEISSTGTVKKRKAKGGQKNETVKASKKTTKKEDLYERTQSLPEPDIPKESPVGRCTIQRRNTVKKFRRNSRDVDAWFSDSESAPGSRRSSFDISPSSLESSSASESTSEIDVALAQEKKPTVKRRKAPKQKIVADVSIENAMSPEPRSPKFIVDEIKVEQSPASPRSGPKKFRYEVIVEDVEEEHGSGRTGKSKKVKKKSVKKEVTDHEDQKKVTPTQDKVPQIKQDGKKCPQLKTFQKAVSSPKEEAHSKTEKISDTKLQTTPLVKDTTNKKVQREVEPKPVLGEPERKLPAFKPVPKKNQAQELEANKMSSKDIQNGKFIPEKGKPNILSSLVPKVEEAKLGKHVIEKINERDHKAQFSPVHKRTPSPDSDDSGINFWAFINGSKEDKDLPSPVAQKPKLGEQPLSKANLQKDESTKVPKGKTGLKVKIPQRISEDEVLDSVTPYQKGAAFKQKNFDAKTNKQDKFSKATPDEKPILNWKVPIKSPKETPIGTSEQSLQKDNVQKEFTPTPSDDTLDTPIPKKSYTPNVDKTVPTSGIGKKVSTPGIDKVSTPVEETKVPTPAVGKKISTPDVGKTISTPDVGKKISTPDVGKKISTPDVGKKISTPDVGKKISTPDVGKKISTPDVGKKISTPDVGKKMSTPSEEKEVSTPGTGNKTSDSSADKVFSPIEEKKISTPGIGKKILTPIEEKNVSTQVTEKKIQTPDLNKKMFTPIEDKKLPTPTEKKIPTPGVGKKISTPVEEKSVTPTIEKKKPGMIQKTSGGIQDSSLDAPVSKLPSTPSDSSSGENEVKEPVSKDKTFLDRNKQKSTIPDSPKLNKDSLPTPTIKESSIEDVQSEKPKHSEHTDEQSSKQKPQPKWKVQKKAKEPAVTETSEEEKKSVEIKDKLNTTSKVPASPTANRKEAEPPAIENAMKQKDVKGITPKMNQKEKDVKGNLLEKKSGIPEIPSAISDKQADTTSTPQSTTTKSSDTETPDTKEGKEMSPVSPKDTKCTEEKGKNLQKLVKDAQPKILKKVPKTPETKLPIKPELSKDKSQKEIQEGKGVEDSKKPEVSEVKKVEDTVDKGPSVVVASDASSPDETKNLPAPAKPKGKFKKVDVNKDQPDKAAKITKDTSDKPATEVKKTEEDKIAKVDDLPSPATETEAQKDKEEKKPKSCEKSKKKKKALSKPEQEKGKKSSEEKKGLKKDDLASQESDLKEKEKKSKSSGESKQAGKVPSRAEQNAKKRSGAVKRRPASKELGEKQSEDKKAEEVPPAPQVPVVSVEVVDGVAGESGSESETETESESDGTSSDDEDEGTPRASVSSSSDDSGFDSRPSSVPVPSASSDSGSTAPLLACSPSLDPYSEDVGGIPRSASGRHTPPATSLPRFRKYTVDDFQFLKVLGKGSFGKVLLAELRGTERYYAIKCLKKDVVLEDDDVECTLIERKVLALGTKHPYLCHLFCTFQTESHLLFVMEYLNGGDLMFHIQQTGRFQENRARFYGAEIVSGLKFLHKKGIVYRDLKLDNILLDYEGHVRIADFGMCKLQIFLDRTADTFCGTPDYMAPEIIKGLKYNQCVDWWSFGVLMFEMLVGVSPFSGCDEDELFWSICNEQPQYPRFLSREAHSILVQLLEKDAMKRLGTPEGVAGDVCNHMFFRNFDWDALERRDLEPPFKPRVKHPLDVQYFDKAFTTESAQLTPVDPGILHSMDQAQFQGFSYTNPNATD